MLTAYIDTVQWTRRRSLLEHWQNLNLAGTTVWVCSPPHYHKCKLKIWQKIHQLDVISEKCWKKCWKIIAAKFALYYILHKQLYTILDIFIVVPLKWVTGSAEEALCNMSLQSVQFIFAISLEPSFLVFFVSYHLHPINFSPQKFSKFFKQAWGRGTFVMQSRTFTH